MVILNKVSVLKNLESRKVHIKFKHTGQHHKPSHHQYIFTISTIKINQKLVSMTYFFIFKPVVLQAISS